MLQACNLKDASPVSKIIVARLRIASDISQGSAESHVLCYAYRPLPKLTKELRELPDTTVTQNAHAAQKGYASDGHPHHLGYQPASCKYK